MPDIGAVASAVADRFGPSNITPPSGYTDPGTAVWKLPEGITTTPTAVVFPPEGEFSYAGFKRSGNLDFPVRWYISDAADLPRATADMYAWASVLLDQLEAAYDLDLTPFEPGGFYQGSFQVTSPVTHAVVTAMRFGKLEYAGQEYTGIEMNVRVHLEEAFSPTT